MIQKTELAQYGRLLGFNLGQAERDYLQHLFLIYLSAYDSGNLVFKGGTALQKVYKLNRFSIDLDFTQKNETDIKSIMEKIAKDINDFGYPTKLSEIKTLGKTFILKIQGPLYNNTPNTSYNLRVEISQRESILLNPDLKQITPPYQDLKPYTVTVMKKEEILAEKVRAIMTRNKPRDIFDLHFLIKDGVKFDIEFINKKLEYYNEQYNHKEFIEKIKEKKAIWEKELRNYILAVPDFDNVIKEIIRIIKK